MQNALIERFPLYRDNAMTNMLTPFLKLIGIYFASLLKDVSLSSFQTYGIKNSDIYEEPYIINA